jgi:hypothetical protein
MGVKALACLCLAVLFSVRCITTFTTFITFHSRFFLVFSFSGRLFCLFRLLKLGFLCAIAWLAICFFRRCRS